MVDGLVRAVAVELRDYGPYLAMRDAEPGEQRFGIPEISMAALSLIAWALGGYGKAYLEEKGKRHASSPLPAGARRDLAERLAELERSVREPRASADEAVGRALTELRRWGGPRVTLSIDEEALIGELRALGLTRRAAREVAPRLAGILATSLSQALTLGDEDARD